MSNIISGILLLIVLVLGYLYYDQYKTIKNNNIEITNLQISLSTDNNEISSLQSEISKLQALTDENNKIISQLNIDKSKLESNIDLANRQIANLNKSLIDTENEINNTKVSSNCQDALNYLLDETDKLIKGLK